MHKLSLLFLCATFAFNGLLAQDTLKVQQDTISIPQDTTRLQLEIFFGSGSVELDSTSIEHLIILIAKIQQLDSCQVKLAAHTDSKGTLLYNKKLAIARAKSISDYLEENEILIDQIEIESFGEKLAGDDKKSEQKRQHNRRVDIIVQGLIGITVEKN